MALLKALWTVYDWQFFDKINPIEKNGSLDIFLFSWEICKLNSRSKLEVNHVFRGLTFFCSIVKFDFFSTWETKWTWNQIKIQTKKNV